jgi:hypothetical protein
VNVLLLSMPDTGLTLAERELYEADMEKAEEMNKFF